MNIPVYLGLSLLKLSKTVMYGLWYDYIKPKHGEKEKMLYAFRHIHFLLAVPLYT